MPWSDETVAAARQALVEAGSLNTLTTFREELDKSTEKGIKKTCQKGIGALDELRSASEKEPTAHRKGACKRRFRRYS